MKFSNTTPSALKLHAIFEVDFNNGKLFWRKSSGSVKAGSEAGTTREDGYRVVQIEGRTYYVHRIIYKMNSHRDTDKRIYFYNGNQSDCRHFNLTTEHPNSKNWFSNPETNEPLASPDWPIEAWRIYCRNTPGGDFTEDYEWNWCPADIKRQILMEHMLS